MVIDEDLIRDLLHGAIDVAVGVRSNRRSVRWFSDDCAELLGESGSSGLRSGAVEISLQDSHIVIRSLIPMRCESSSSANETEWSPWPACIALSSLRLLLVLPLGGACSSRVTILKAFSDCRTLVTLLSQAL